MVGEIWAYRERPNTVACPVIKAEVLQFGPKKSGKVRIRLHGGEFAGLDTWVPKLRLRVPWDETEAWLQDERALDAVSQASRAASSTTAYQAADVVFAAYPRPDGIMLDWPCGTDSVCIEDVVAVVEDLGTSVERLLQRSLAFLDRKGIYHAPAAAAEDLARLVIAKYAEAVLSAVFKEEDELQTEAVHGRVYGDDVWSPRVPPEECAKQLRDRQPVFELVREWCGERSVERFDELAAMRIEVERLRKLVLEAGEKFGDRGHPQLAARFKKLANNPGGDE